MSRSQLRASPLSAEFRTAAVEMECMFMESGTVTRPCWWQMPELPEVEITRRHLANALEGRVFTDVRVGHVRDCASQLVT